jgi:UDP-galactopyranose mutase
MSGVPDLICFSCVPWDFIYHRPQHLMTRFAKHFRVIYVEPPAYGEGHPSYELSYPKENIISVKLRLPAGLPEEQAANVQQEKLAQFLNDLQVKHYVFWYYSPVALTFTNAFQPVLKVYDCMTEFPYAQDGIDVRALEDSLLRQADFVFTAGPSLHETRRSFNQNTYCLPGSVDIDHFYGARYYHADPAEQAKIPHPRIGFAGVIDDRIDFTLLKAVALRKPEWHLVLLGPIVGLKKSDLPELSNLHFIEKKSYEELPGYISGWNITMLPFAHTDATRFINPLQATEFLAAGKPVIAAPVIDIIRTYGNRGLIQIAGTPEEFVRVANTHFTSRDKTEWNDHVAEFLSLNSWDKTWQRMMDMIWPRVRENMQQEITTSNDKIYA